MSFVSKLYLSLILFDEQTRKGVAASCHKSLGRVHSTGMRLQRTNNSGNNHQYCQYMYAICLFPHYISIQRIR